jgi:hypothetical protein
MSKLKVTQNHKSKEIITIVDKTDEEPIPKIKKRKASVSPDKVILPLISKRKVKYLDLESQKNCNIQ